MALIEKLKKGSSPVYIQISGKKWENIKKNMKVPQGTQMDNVKICRRKQQEINFNYPVP